MINHLLWFITAIKLMFMPVYHSTDFEVHRNWLAITHNLTIDEWYYDSTSEWTLDYPPFFAWLECGLSYVAVYFDPKMLELSNLNYASFMTVMFQRLSVIVLDVIYIMGVKSCTKLLSRGEPIAFLLLVASPGLLMVDHIHFQYNGFMYGILMYSISKIIRSNHLQAAFWFAVLLNFKHIFLYIAPVYVVYLFRAYCFTISSEDGEHTAWYSFELMNLIKLGTVVVTVLMASFGPFMDHLPQILNRLFPFKRGLSHAYWAPNFWALYNFGDKVLQHTLPKIGYAVTNKTEAAMTGGLVQEFEHAVLPSITPSITFWMTLLAMLPALVKMWNLCADSGYRTMGFIRCIIVCASCSFLFGWHVHEKAILMILIPLSFMSVLGDQDAKFFLILSTVGHYSLFPLLYPKSLLGIKLFMLLTHMSIAFSFIPSMYETKVKVVKRNCIQLPMLNYTESFYIYGLMFLCMYENVVHPVWGLHKTLPFLPLMMTSVYCSIGVIYVWAWYYHYFLTFNLSWVPTFVTASLLNYLKKNR